MSRRCVTLRPQSPLSTRMGRSGYAAGPASVRGNSQKHYRKLAERDNNTGLVTRPKSDKTI